MGGGWNFLCLEDGFSSFAMKKESLLWVRSLLAVQG